MCDTIIIERYLYSSLIAGFPILLNFQTNISNYDIVKYSA